MLHQGLRQRLQQKLTPQQIQLLQLLQVPAMQLEDRIKEELEVNPALESPETDNDFNDENPTSETDFSSENDNDETAPESEEISREDDFDLNDYYDEDVADYKTKDPNEFSNDDDERDRFTPVAKGKSLQDFLLEQVEMQELEPRELEIVRHLIGSLDDDGYLRRDLDAVVDDLSFKQNIYVTIDEVKSGLEIIQELDPAGIGAQTLEQCLLLQIERKKMNKYMPVAYNILEKHFDLLVKKNYDRLQKELNVDATTLKKAIAEITKLNPKPGNAYSSEAIPEQTVIPDFVVTNQNGELLLTLTSANFPELRISRNFRDMASEYKRSKKPEMREALTFMKQKIDSAKWFIDAVKQRQETLSHTMKAIVELQHDFFITGDEAQLKPMILQDVADRIGLDISTISRVVSSKFVQTEFGTLSLRFFFSEGITLDSGDEVSTRKVKQLLQEMVD
ncbi:MAG TPA: RNA polymerase factor sigma-54, partial [Chitinophagales bacterium]